MNTAYHIPVMLRESVDALITDPSGVYVDATFGGGGHSHEILRQLSKGKLLAFDQDSNAEKNAELFSEYSNFQFFKSNFAYVKNFLRFAEIGKADGLIADLGVSSHQFDTPERGFSFREEAELDMRMNENAQISAKLLLNTAEEQELERIFRDYGELDNVQRVVRAIGRERKKSEIRTTSQLNAILFPLAPRNKDYKFFAQAYQALRIAVNNEMQALHELLLSCSEIVKPGGRIVFITYHSLEDRPVKNFIKYGNIAGEPDSDIFGNVKVPFRSVGTKIITPSEAELAVNGRARSAKLRIAEKL